MAFQVSPGVNVSEIDLTTVVPAVSTTEGAFAGVFKWGPVEQRILIESENELVNRFGKPDDTNAETFFTAANFLAYGNKLYVVRVANTFLTVSAYAGVNSSANVANAGTNSIKNRDDYDSRTSFDANCTYIAKCPGSLGNSLRVSVCDSPNAYSINAFAAFAGAGANISAVTLALTVGSNVATFTAANTADAQLVGSTLPDRSILRVGNSSIGYQDLSIVSSDANASVLTVSLATPYRLSVNVSANSTTVANSLANGGFQVTRNWEFYNYVDGAPTTSDYAAERGGIGDELHIVVYDRFGAITGTVGTILETFPNLSLATDAKTADGSSIYYKTVINDQSNWVWAANDRAGRLSNVATSFTALANTLPYSGVFKGGVDGESEANVAISVELNGFAKFTSAEDLDVSLILSGRNTSGAVKADWIIDNICETRKDCIAFISPPKSNVVNNLGEITTDLVNFRNSVTSTSYAVIDSGYKYTYDKYNDVYRYVPLNGDIAGLVVRTDTTRDPWFSPAGFNRGIIKNVVKLAYNPSKADRDILYKNGINPVVTFPGQGTLLYGDKTALAKPSAFDRINVRRLFITLEKAIATAAKFTLFEFNDEFTRAQFRNLIEPYLRDVQGRRGIIDYRVVCDDSNNTAEVIDRNEFVGDIFIKPARSINFIQLNFVAVRSGVEFSEIVGNFG
jgi:phage tail sheath protein FI